MSSAELAHSGYAPSRLVAEGIPFYYFFKETMADDSHEMSSFIFSEKI